MNSMRTTTRVCTADTRLTNTLLSQVRLGINAISVIEKDDDLNRALFEVSKDIEAASNGSLIDARHIQMLFGTYLPEYFKLLFSRRYHY